MVVPEAEVVVLPELLGRVGVAEAPPWEGGVEELGVEELGVEELADEPVEAAGGEPPAELVDGEEVGGVEGVPAGLLAGVAAGFGGFASPEGLGKSLLQVAGPTTPSGVSPAAS